MSYTGVELNPGTGGASIGVDDIGGIKYEVVKQAFGSEGTMTAVSAANPLPVNNSNSEYQSYKTPISFGTITAIAGLAASATVGAITDRISNLTEKAQDYNIGVKFTMANTAPGGSKAVYLLLVPWWWDGTTWYSNSQGTTTLPPATNGASTLAQPHNLPLLLPLAYTTQNMVLQGVVSLRQAYGSVLPDGFSIFVNNDSGSAITAATMYYEPIHNQAL